MGSTLVGVLCQLHQLPPTSSARRHLAQFLKRHPAPLDNVIPCVVFPLVFVLNSSKHQLLYLPVVMHSAYVPNSPSFLPVSFCMIFSFSCIRPYKSVFFTFCVHPILSIFL